MTIEVDPGTGGQPVEEGTTLPLASSQPNVQPDQIFASLDGDTRSFLQLLLQAAGKGLGRQRPQAGGGPEALRALRARPRPHQRGSRRAPREHQAGDHELRPPEPGARPPRYPARRVRPLLQRRPGARSRARRPRSAPLLRELPGTLSETRRALVSGDRFAQAARSRVAAADPRRPGAGPGAAPGAAAVPQHGRPDPRPDPALRARRAAAAQAGQAARQAAGRRPRPSSTKSFSELNRFFNALAYNPPGSAEEGYLFWASWLNHNTNALFFTQDAGGPLRHGLVLLSCLTASARRRR